MLTGRKIVVAPFSARSLRDDGRREFAPGELLVLQPYVWAGPNDEAFTFDGINYGVPAAVLDECTALQLRVAETAKPA